MDLKLLLDKLSQYRIFNYLFPGIIFAAIGSKLTTQSLLLENVLAGIFVYYFYGVVISRVGSIVIEPTLKKIGFVNFAPYNEYVIASKSDDKIDLFSEENNMYRTLISTFFCLLIIHIFDKIRNSIALVSENSPVIALIFMMVLFLFSYRKQTEYIKSRIKEALKNVPSVDN